MNAGDNYQRLRREIPNEVEIVLAGKTRSPEELAEVIDAGATAIGENYVQEAETAIAALGEKARQVSWHMIGELQKNKINKALPLFDVIQTVDSLKKAQAIELRAERFGKVMPVYLEVNIAAEASKSGLPADIGAIEALAKEMAGYRHLCLEGVMTMGPLTGDPEDSRPWFRQARRIFDHLRNQNLPETDLRTLSMGMSHSYRVAIEEGSTMVRLGTIVFGPR